MLMLNFHTENRVDLGPRYTARHDCWPTVALFYVIFSARVARPLVNVTSVQVSLAIVGR